VNSFHPPGGVTEFRFSRVFRANPVPPQGLAAATRMKNADSLDVAAARDLIT
jgi:hypothetical protein